MLLLFHRARLFVHLFSFQPPFLPVRINIHRHFPSIWSTSISSAAMSQHCHASNCLLSSNSWCVINCSCVGDNMTTLPVTRALCYHTCLVCSRRTPTLQRRVIHLGAGGATTAAIAPLASCLASRRGLPSPVTLW